MMEQIKLGSLFSGSGGFELGAILAGIRPVWNSEIEPFPIRVTTRRLPSVKHYGDVSAINGAQIEPVDIITFGSPCQDMSIAGKRDGLGGSQSSLFYQAVRIVKEMREETNGQYPRYIVWENVPGAFSSNKGEDFRTVLEEICRIKDPAVSVAGCVRWQPAGCILGNGYSVAWRVLDAQYWGVPQRRKRIYLVADLDGKRAGKILFESEGVSGYSGARFKAWQRAAGSLAPGPGTAGTIYLNDQGGIRMDVTEERANTLRAEAHHQAVVLFENHGNDSRYTGPLESAPTMAANYGEGGNNQPFVVHQNTFGICSKDSNSMKSDNPKSGFYDAETSRTLDGNGGNPSCNQGGIAVVSIQGSMIGRKDENGPQGSGIGDDVSFALNTVDRHAVAYSNSKASYHTRFEKNMSPTLVASDYKDPVTVSFGIGRDAYNMGQNAKFGMSLEQDVQPTLTARGPGAVAYSSSRAGFWLDFQKEKSGSLIAGGYKGQNTVAVLENTAVNLTNSKQNGVQRILQSGETQNSQSNNAVQRDYTVRRLTPTECARLQGFPDWWCANLETPEPTDEEIRFWMDVFETHRKVMGTAKKARTRNQIVKWLKNPHTDSAEYKMWGNGVALPCVYFVLAGIACFFEKKMQK